MLGAHDAPGGGRLLRLDVEDFKSYGGAHVIGPFEDALTAVVGPNGAGKSNLMDALCFVLGVQSAALRATSLGELVHRPVSGPRPAAATVTATYVRADGSELRFTRRALLSGSAEYRIDGRSVGAAEYARRWADEGVHARARNSLVFQGDVEALATRSPRDLARVLEGVCGSDELRDEYDAARAELDAAVEEAAGNAARRRGVGAELRAVAEQRADAQRHASLLAEAAELRRTLFLARLWGVESSAAAIESSLPEMAGAVSAAESALAAAEAQAPSDRARAGVTEAQRRLLGSEREVRAAEEQLGAARPRLAAVTEEAGRAERRLRDAEAALAVAQRDAHRAQEEADAARAAADESDAALAAFESRLPQMEGADDATLGEYRRLRAEADAAAARLSLEAAAAAHRLAPARASLSVLASRADEAQRAVQRAQRDAAAAEAARAELEREVGCLLEEKRAADEAVQREDAAQRRDDEAAAEATARLRAIAEELLAAGAAAADGERETRVRVAVAGLKRAFPGAVHGRLAELVRPSARKYDAAAAVALGSALDAVVVSDERTAVAALALLREQRHPRLTLLPLDVLRTTTGAPDGESSGSPALPAEARWARDVLRYDAGFSAAVEWAVGRVAVVDSLAGARRVSRLPGVSRAVSLDGGVVHRSGLMAGGAYENAASRWDAESVSRLRAERDALLERLRAAAARRAAGDAVHGARSGAASASAALARAQSRLAVAERRAASAAASADAAAAEAARMRASYDEAAARLSSDEAEAARIASSIAEIEARVFATFLSATGYATVGAWEAALASSSHAGLSAAVLEAARGVGAERASLQAEASRRGQAHVFASERLSAAQRRLSDATQLAEGLRESFARLNLQLSELQGTVDRLTAALHSAQTAHQHAQAQADAERAQLAAAEAHRAGLQERLAAASRAHVSAAVDLDRLRLERERLLRSARLEGVVLPFVGDSAATSNATRARGRSKRGESDTSHSTHTANQSAATIEYPREVRDGKTAVADVEARLEAACAEAERIAPGLRPADAVDGAEERLRETLGACERERERLRAAKERFGAVRSERQRRFAAALSHVAARVDAIYRALAGGGAAFVAAENAEEPYLEGVRFHAMPPMKRFLDMEHLSGGERTVAALALLFALQTFRPAPFFVLDEVDAALDAHNVSRLASFLRAWAAGTAVVSGSRASEGSRLSLGATQSQASQPGAEPGATALLPPTQFVLISLKAALYEHADALVGVVRDPPTRASRVLTLRLAGLAQ